MKDIKHTPFCIEIVKISTFFPAFLLLGFLSLNSTSAKAQICSEFQLNEVKKQYKIGKFADVVRQVNACLNTGFATIKQEEEALAILAKTHLEQNDIQSAAIAINELLQINPNYEAASGDPGIFKKLINDFKLATIAQTVTSVSKKAENVKEAPATVLVITEQDIQERGYIDLEQLFSDLPGFDVSRTYGITYSNLYQRGYRSDNTDRTLFLVDGVEDNDLWSGGVYLARQYPITNVKRVEIVYGPASTMYGANAFLGVVNVVTKDDQNFKAGSFVSANAEVGYGTYNTQYADITLMLRKNNISASFTARRFYSEEMDLSDYPEFDFNPDDYDSFDYKSKLSVESDANGFARTYSDRVAFNNYFSIERNGNGDTIAVRLTDLGEQTARSSDKNALSGELNGNPIKYSNLTDHWFFYGKLKISDFTIGFQSWQSKNGTTNYYHDNKRAGPDNGAIWQPKQTFVYAKYEKDISSSLTIQNIAQYKVSEVGDESNTVEIRNYANGKLDATSLLTETEENGVAVSAPTESFWYNFYISIISKQFRDELKLNYSPISNLNFVSGVEIRNSIVQGDYRISYDNDISAIESGTASGDALPGGNDYHSLDFGAYSQASYELPYMKFTLGLRYDYNRIRSSGGYGSQFSPRAAIVATPGNFIFKAIYARAFQNASILKKYATTDARAANPNLQPETAVNFEISAGYNISKSIYADMGYYNAMYYGIATVKDGLELADGKTQQFRALGEIQVQGVQANVSGKWRNFRFFGNYTYTRPKNNIVEEGKLTDDFERVGDIASHQFNIGITGTFFQKLSTHIRTNYIGDRPVGEKTTIRKNIGDFPAVTLLNGSISYKDIIPGLTFQLIGNNLLNKEYFDPGIRTANVSTYAYRVPQRRRNFIVRLMYDF